MRLLPTEFEGLDQADLEEFALKPFHQRIGDTGRNASLEQWAEEAKFAWCGIRLRQPLVA